MRIHVMKKQSVRRTTTTDRGIRRSDTSLTNSERVLKRQGEEENFGDIPWEEMKAR